MYSTISNLPFCQLMAEIQSSELFHTQIEDLTAECGTHKQLCLDQGTYKRYRPMLQFEESRQVCSFLLQNPKTL